MANEGNKQFNRFQFSTEIDRGETKSKAKKTTSHKSKKKPTTRRSNRRSKTNKKELLKGDSVMNKKEYKEKIEKIMNSIVIDDDDPTNDVEEYKEELLNDIEQIEDKDESYNERLKKIMDSIVIEEDDDPTNDVDEYKEKLKKIMDSIVIEEDDYKDRVKKIMDTIVIEDDDPTDDVDEYKEELKKMMDTIVFDDEDEKYEEKIKAIMDTIVIEEDDDPTNDVDEYKEKLKQMMDTIVFDEEDEKIPTADFKVFADDEPPVETRDNGEEGISVSAENIVVNDNEKEEEPKDKESQAFLDELETLKEKGVNINEVKDIDLDHTLYRDQYFVKDTAEDKVVEEVKNAIENTSELSKTDLTTESRAIKRVYLSFKARVVLLIVGILILFGAACFIIASALNNNTIRKIGYTEKSTIKYEVCQNVMNITNAACMPEGGKYKASTTSKIPLKYHYEAKFDEEIDYNLAYHVVIVNKLYDHNDANKVLYEDETIAVEKKEIQEGMSPVTADIDVDIDFQKYYNFVNEYKQKYSINAESQLNVILYIDDGTDTRNVGEVIIPVTTENYNITRNEVKDEKQEYSLAERDWTNANTIYIIIGSVLVLLSLFLLFHLTKLALSVTGKKSKYQEYLMSILNEYDRLIVIARDGYESNVEKRVVKVYTFNELLDARNSLNKPIIYSRINNVKSEFIVEDDEVIYKFVLKEADMGE